MAPSIRDAQPADYPVFARLYPALGTPRPILTAPQFAERMLPNVVIAEEGAEPVGYSAWRLLGPTLHVAHVVVDAGARRRGVGRALLEEVRRRAVASACTHWSLDVVADNAPAIRLYERAGLLIERRGWSLLAAWSDLLALPGSTGTRTFEPSTEQGVRFVERHGRPREWFAHIRAKPGAIFVALRDDAGMCGLASFDLAFPGIQPIFVDRTEHARPIFDALFPHAVEPRVEVWVDGDAALAAMLQEAGARLRLETLHMGAALP